MPTQTYPLSYLLRINDPPLSVEDAKQQAQEGFGACDAVVLLSVLYPPDGSYSLLVRSRDGRTQESLPDHEVFKAWLMLSDYLANSPTIEPWRREFAREVFNSFWSLFDSGEPREPE